MGILSDQGQGKWQGKGKGNRKGHSKGHSKGNDKTFDNDKVFNGNWKGALVQQVISMHKQTKGKEIVSSDLVNYETEEDASADPQKKFTCTCKVVKPNGDEQS